MAQELPHNQSPDRAFAVMIAIPVQKYFKTRGLTGALTASRQSAVRAPG